MELFTALGVNSTIWLQFFLTFSIFVGLSQIAFSPFLMALQERENRTLGSVEKAEQILRQTQSLQAKYETLMRDLNSQIKAIFKEQELIATRQADEMQALARASEQQRITRLKESLAQQLQSEKSKISQWVVDVSNAIVKKAVE
jgi:F0F1-type ATP synthase membrane subunit b/b'